jgi:predicted transcriptional regulator
MTFFFWTREDYDALMGTLRRIEAHQREMRMGMQKHFHRQETLMSALDDLAAQVEKNTSLEASAVTLIQGIATQLKEALARNDNAAITALTQQLATNAEALAAAVSANTPAAEVAA